MKNFRDKKFRILIATDVAARGLDVPHIEHVINYDLPQMAEDFIHRIGRTARAGSEGIALSFVTKGDFLKWKEIQNIFNPSKNNQSQRGKKFNSSNRKPFSKKRYDKADSESSFKKPFKKKFSGKSDDARSRKPFLKTTSEPRKRRKI